MIPTFITSRLCVRPVCATDIPAWHRHFNCYEIIGELASSVPWPFPADGTEQFVRNKILPNQGHDRWTWAICLKELPNELIGVIDLWREGSPENRGFWLAREFWGRGYMSEATYPVTDFAFQDLGFEKLIFNNALGNDKSRRVKERVGATHIGTVPKLFVNPDYTQAEIWELTRQNWERYKQHTTALYEYSVSKPPYPD
mgnify:CR=1 FL=1